MRLCQHAHKKVSALDRAHIKIVQAQQENIDEICFNSYWEPNRKSWRNERRDDHG